MILIIGLTHMRSEVALVVILCALAKDIITDDYHSG